MFVCVDMETLDAPEAGVFARGVLKLPLVGVAPGMCGSGRSHVELLLRLMGLRRLSGVLERDVDSAAIRPDLRRGQFGC